ncbi:MAG: helix-turn-helix transcriptional regulator [Ruminococcus sp.]|nr:helix-turn-helix transcriptional regulator [Ruminococcus sp.]
MNILNLKAEMARCDLTIPKLAELIGMDKKTLYSRFNGETEFKQTEIVKISQELNLCEEQILNIFLADAVS